MSLIHAFCLWHEDKLCWSAQKSKNWLLGLVLLFHCEQKWHKQLKNSYLFLLLQCLHKSDRTQQTNGNPSDYISCLVSILLGGFLFACWFVWIFVLFFGGVVFLVVRCLKTVIHNLEHRWPLCRASALWKHSPGVVSRASILFSMCFFWK